MRNLRFVMAGLCIAVAACGANDLVVSNPDNPNVPRVLATPGDVETYIGASWTAWYKAELGGTNNQIRPPIMTMAFENSSALNNFAMGPRSGFPRSFIDNSLGNGFANENYYDYQNLQAAARQAANGLAKLNTGFSIGTAQRDARAKAFGWYVLGMANGDNALLYDSVGVVAPTDTVDPTRPPSALRGAQDANTIALAQLDSAITWANTWNVTAAPPAPATSKTTLEGNWIPLPSGVTISATDLVALIHSYKARLRTEVARTAAQRAAVDWTKVIADASAGYPTDLNLNLPTTLAVADGQHYSFSTWHQQSPMIIGMADSVRAGCSSSTANGDCYDAWLAQGLDGRYRFLIRTADRRFPQGDTRAAQQAQPDLDPTKYFRNHANGQDSPAQTQDLSEYDQIRFLPYGTSSSGPYIILTRAEINLDAAEGYMRNGDFANAMALINISRVQKGRLPGLTGITSMTQPIATGVAANSCVPRVPQPPNYNTAACGNIFEALKWEKRMETELTTFGAWFYDSRGWGDLPVGTPQEWPTPYQERQFYGKGSYNLGGVGGQDAAPLSTYGY